MSQLLIYGVTGYTGDLVAREAVRRGLSPILAGRNRTKVEQLATELGTEFRVFDLVDPAKTAESLGGIGVVLNVAGPFAITAEPLLIASINAGAHYLDTTAELATFFMTEKHAEAARVAGIMIMSGTGWDVVPSDALAVRTANRVVDPLHLRLGLKIYVGEPDTEPPLLFSRGSITSALGFGSEAGAIRRDRRITRLSTLSAHAFDFGFGPEDADPAPMGDLVTAWHSTGIPNIEVFVAGGVPLPTMAAGEELPAGPSSADRLVGRARVAAEVTGRDGHVVRGIVDTPTGYGFTQRSSVEIAARALAGDFKVGFQTPASAYGPSILTSIADSYFIDL